MHYNFENESYLWNHVSEMEEFMQKLKENVTVGIVGGSDYKKITEQLGLVWFS